MAKTIHGLDRLLTEKSLQEKIKGNIGYLCHNASITHDFKMGVVELQKLFGKRLIKLFGPQHGFVTDVQDNMVETNHYVHSYFNVPVYSLYSETRIPTDEMLKDLNCIIIDLQDVGTRVYTYISTMTLLMEKCSKLEIEVIVLDRPNPVGGEMIEGTILRPNLKSFVGRHPIPQRHSLTMGEMAMYAKKYHGADCPLSVIEMKNWNRSMYFQETGLPWANPSPNLSTPESAHTFVGTVLFEGTNVSEARGTTRALEMCGHPKIEPFHFHDQIVAKFKKEGLEEFKDGYVIRPVVFLPTFQKFQGQACGGFQIHLTNPKARSWAISQLLCREFYHHLGSDFKWKDTPYEYEYDKLAIDLINGVEDVRHWVEKNGDLSALTQIETIGHENFLNERENIILYR